MRSMTQKKKKKITLNYNKNRLLIVSMVIALKSCVNYLYKHTHTHKHKHKHKQTYFHFELYQIYHIIDFFIIIYIQIILLILHMCYVYLFSAFIIHSLILQSIRLKIKLRSIQFEVQVLHKSILLGFAIVFFFFWGFFFYIFVIFIVCLFYRLHCCLAIFLGVVVNSKAKKRLWILCLIDWCLIYIYIYIYKYIYEILNLWDLLNFYVPFLLDNDLKDCSWSTFFHVIFWKEIINFSAMVRIIVIGKSYIFM